MSYTKLLYHVAFRTKYGKNTIAEQHEKELYAHIMGIIKKNAIKRLVLRKNTANCLIFDFNLLR